MGSFLKIGQGAYELCLFKYGDFYLNIGQNYRSIWAKISESGGISKSHLVKNRIEPIANQIRRRNCTILSGPYNFVMLLMALVIQ